MFKQITPKTVEFPGPFPHCDPRILHAPGECEYCDAHPDWQGLRQFWRIAFTGWTPEEQELPCPADFARGDTHTLWPNNQAKKVTDDDVLSDGFGNSWSATCSQCKQKSMFINRPGDARCQVCG